jgi:hypothetical protein
MEVGNPTVVLPRSKDFPNDLQVFLEIGDDVEGAKFGPYPRRFIEHFSGAVKGNLYSMERNGELDGLAEVTLPFIENGVELKFTGAMFRPIDRYLTNARFEVDLNDVWILADFLVMIVCCSSRGLDFSPSSG